MAKEALLGVIAPACKEMRLPYLACKGYMSQSEMYTQAQEFIRQESEGKTCWILHIGDHDPSGIQMSEDIETRMQLFGADVTFMRIALNLDQIRELNPPPNPAKQTDSRYRQYVERFNIDESWEVDALTPTYTDNLIRMELNGLINWSDWDKIMDEESDELKVFSGLRRNWQAVKSYMLQNNLT